MAEERLESETGILNFVNYVEKLPLLSILQFKGDVISILGSPVAIISTRNIGCMMTKF